MGITRLDAMMIQGNEVECAPEGPYENNKYGGCIYLIKNGSRHTPIISVDYGYYDSAKDAVEKLEQAVEEIRKVDVFKEKGINES